MPESFGLLSSDNIPISFLSVRCFSTRSTFHSVFLINAKFMPFSELDYRATVLCVSLKQYVQNLLCFILDTIETLLIQLTSRSGAVVWSKISRVFMRNQWHHMWTGLRHAALTASADLQHAEMVFFRVLTGFPLSSISNRVLLFIPKLLFFCLFCVLGHIFETGMKRFFVCTCACVCLCLCVLKGSSFK